MKKNLNFFGLAITLTFIATFFMLPLNAQSYASSFTSKDKAMCDLVVQKNISVSKKQHAPGTSFDIRYKISNAGKVASFKTKVEYRLVGSKGNKFQDAVLVGTDKIIPMRARGSVMVNGTINLPADLKDGKHVIQVRVIPVEKREMNLKNNMTSFFIAVKKTASKGGGTVSKPTTTNTSGKGSGRPNGKPKGNSKIIFDQPLKINKADAFAGQTIKSKVSIKNFTSKTVETVRVTFYLDKSSRLSKSALMLSDQKAQVKPRLSNVVKTSLSIPEKTRPGVYYIHALVESVNGQAAFAKQKSTTAKIVIRQNQTADDDKPEVDEPEEDKPEADEPKDDKPEVDKPNKKSRFGQLYFDRPISISNTKVKAGSTIYYKVSVNSSYTESNENATLLFYADRTKKLSKNARLISEEKISVKPDTPKVVEGKWTIPAVVKEGDIYIHAVVQNASDRPSMRKKNTVVSKISIR